jgi:hypothetical protein
MCSFRAQTYLELLPSIFIECSIIIQNVDKLKPMTDTNLIIVRIMSWRDLHCASSKLLVYIFINDNGKAPVQEGMNGKLAMKVLQAYLNLDCDFN